MNPDDPIDLPPSLQARLAGGDLLGTYWPTVIALALALLVLGWMGWRRHRVPRGGRRRALMTSALWLGTTALLLVGVVLGVNTWVGYIPSVQAAQRWWQTGSDQPGQVAPDPVAQLSGGGGTGGGAGRVTSAEHGYAYQVTIPSTSDKVPDSAAWVYLPPDYDRRGQDARYPVVYALHGAPGTAADWFSGGMIDRALDELITSGYLPPVIVVSPDLNAGGGPVDSEPLDLPGGPQLERFVREDVVAWADANLRTRTDAGDRVIAGMSAGGLGALVAGLHHPEVFGGVISLLPYDDPYTASIVADPTALAADTPTSILAGQQGTATQPVFLGLGDSERPAAARAIERALRASGRPATLRVYAGQQHNWVAARTMMPYGLVWIGTQLGWSSGAG
jgi:uncharacterized protein (TIGR03382 family)